MSETTVELREVKTQVAAATNDVGLALKEVISSTSKALEDGFQAGQDIPAVVMASYQKLAIAMESFKNVSPAFKGEPVKASLGALIPVAEALDEVVK